MVEQTVAYLDILGFKNFTVLNPIGAARLLADYNVIINTKLADMAQFPASRNDEPGLHRLALVNEVGSFETFLPCSDSIFIVSGQTDLLLEQVSRFLIDSFRLTSDAFAFPQEANDPTAVTISEFSPRGMVSRKQEHWFPLLFRGGIAGGEVITQAVTTIVQGRGANSVNLNGAAVVHAVGLEKIGKGPRLFCAAAFLSKVNERSRRLFRQVENCGHHELLWPALIYHDGNPPPIEINHFADLFLPAVHLWRFYRHEPPVEAHYLEFLRLIVKATLTWFEAHNSVELATDHIKERLSRLGLEELKEALLK